MEGWKDGKFERWNIGMLGWNYLQITHFSILPLFQDMNQLELLQFIK